MQIKRWLVLFSLVLWFPGCMSLKGERLLKNEQYQDGVATFKSIVREEPRNPEAQYYLGRFYLALERPEEGLPISSRLSRVTLQKQTTTFGWGWHTGRLWNSKRSV